MTSQRFKENLKYMVINGASFPDMVLEGRLEPVFLIYGEREKT